MVSITSYRRWSMKSRTKRGCRVSRELGAIHRPKARKVLVGFGPHHGGILPHSLVGFERMALRPRRRIPKPEVFVHRVDRFVRGGLLSGIDQDLVAN